MVGSQAETSHVSRRICLSPGQVNQAVSSALFYYYEFLILLQGKSTTISQANTIHVSYIHLLDKLLKPITYHQRAACSQAEEKCTSTNATRVVQTRCLLQANIQFNIYMTNVANVFKHIT